MTASAAAPTTGGGALRRSVRRHRGAMVTSVAFLTSWHVCETLVPVLIGVVIDRAVATGEPVRLMVWLVVLAALFVVLANSFKHGSRAGFSAATTEAHLLRTEIAAHVLSPRGARTGRNAGQTLTLATGDADLGAELLGVGGFVVSATVSLALAVTVLLRIDVGLGLLVVVGVPVSLGVLQLLTPRIVRDTDLQQEQIGRATGAAADLVRGLRPLKGVGAEDVALQRYRVLSGQARDAGVRAVTSYGRLNAVGGAVSGLLLAVVAVVAGRLALRGEISVGELVTVVAMTQYLAEPVQLLAGVVAALGQARAGAGRIVDFLATPPLVRAGARKALGHRLDLDGVRSGPLRALDLVVRPGELVCVVATEPTVAERITTLLAGEDDLESGSARLGGAALAELDITSRRRLLVVNPHRADLFEGTLRSNVIGPGREGLDASDFDRVLTASAASDVADLFDDGLDHPVTTDGTTLSGGQRQRLALARALAADPPLLVLHDPTTAVDAVTEQRIAAGLRSVRHAAGSDRTTLVLTSSPALLAVADRVLLVQDGRLVSQGRHDELLEDDRRYREAVLR